MQWKIIPRSQCTSSHFESSRMPSRQQILRPEERNSHGFSGDVYGNPCASANTVSTSYGSVPHSCEKSATHGDPVQPSSSVQGRHPKYSRKRAQNLWRKARNKTQTQIKLRDLQRDRQPDVVTLHRKECIHRIIWLHQGYEFRNFILANSLLHLRFRVGK